MGGDIAENSRPGQPEREIHPPAQCFGDKLRKRLWKIFHITPEMSCQERRDSYLGWSIFAFAGVVFIVLKVFNEEVGSILRKWQILPNYIPVFSRQYSLWGIIVAGISGFILPFLASIAYKYCMQLWGKQWKITVMSALVFYVFISILWITSFFNFCFDSLEFYYPNKSIYVWYEVGFEFYIYAVVFGFFYARTIFDKIFRKKTASIPTD